MHRVYKYINESLSTVISIVGIIIIITATLITSNLFIDYYASSPRTIQAMVVAKHVKESNVPLNNNDTYKVLIKTEISGLQDMSISANEFNRIKNQEQYVFQVKRDKILYTIVDSQDDFLEESKITKADISITERDIQTAMELGYQSSGNLVAIGDNSNSEVDKDSDIDTDIADKDNGQVNTDDNIEPIEEEDPQPVKKEEKPNTPEQPVENTPDKPIEEPVYDNTEDDNASAIGTRQAMYELVNLATDKSTEVSIKTTVRNYKVSLSFPGMDDIDCKNIPSDKGQCLINEGKIIINPSQNDGDYVLVKIHHDKATEANFELTY